MKILLTMTVTTIHRKVEVVKTITTTSTSLGLEAGENTSLMYLVHGGQS